MERQAGPINGPVWRIQAWKIQSGDSGIKKDIIAQITEEEEVTEEGEDDFQQISPTAETASQLWSAVRWLETQAIDPV